MEQVLVCLHLPGWHALVPEQRHPHLRIAHLDLSPALLTPPAERQAAFPEPSGAKREEKHPDDAPRFQKRNQNREESRLTIRRQRSPKNIGRLPVMACP